MPKLEVNVTAGPLKQPTMSVLPTVTDDGNAMVELSVRLTVLLPCTKRALVEPP